MTTVKTNLLINSIKILIIEAIWSPSFMTLEMFTDDLEPTISLHSKCRK